MYNGYFCIGTFWVAQLKARPIAISVIVGEFFSLNHLLPTFDT